MALMALVKYKNIGVFTAFRQIFDKMARIYWLKISLLDQPDSDIIPETPTEAPSSSPSCILLPEKTNACTCCPIPLRPPITVVVWDMPPAIGWALYSGIH